MKLAQLGPAARAQVQATAVKQAAKRKYYSVPTVIDGIRFDSKLEARLWMHLEAARRAGEVKWCLRQPSFDVAAGIRYRADFLVMYSDGQVAVLDAKGMDTPNSKTKRAVVEQRYGIKIRVLTKADIP